MSGNSNPLTLDDCTVVARNLSKTYRVPLSESKRLQGLLPTKTMDVNAVRDVSFVAKKGEAIGILGKNGSGKSTLLRMVAGVERPTAGGVMVSGEPSLLGVSAALQPRLTGYENIRLGLLAMGFPKDEMAERLESVARLSALENEALLRPMNTYSSGMSARLTFAIATSRNPEILMIDEALGTGDATFAEVARKRMDELLTGAGTVFMVSHSAATLRKTCEKAIWLHEGVVVMEGNLSEISPEYAKWGEFTTQGEFDKAREIVEGNLREYVRPRIVFNSEASMFLE